MAKVISAAVSRIVVDVERFAEDERETMSRTGRGMVYTHTHGGRKMRQKISPDERASLKSSFYDPHWQRLRHEASGRVLVDLHSYPVSPWAVEPNQSAPRPEIDIGFEMKLTPNVWLEAIHEHFERQDYEVRLNTPYSGVIDAGADAAVMIEIRRDLMEAWRQGKDNGRLVRTLSSIPAPPVL